MPTPATGTPARAPTLETSRSIVIAAVRWAASVNLKVVASADPGIHCTSTTACTWEPDPHFQGVNPIGAAVLHRRAIASDHDTRLPSADLDTACFLAVGESVRWLEAFSVGIAGLNPPRTWAGHPAVRLMTNAYLFGVELYNLAHMEVCPQHPDVRHVKTEKCRRCAAEQSDSALTPMDPNAGMER